MAARTSITEQRRLLSLKSQAMQLRVTIGEKREKLAAVRAQLKAARRPRAR